MGRCVGSCTYVVPYFAVENNDNATVPNLKLRVIQIFGQVKSPWAVPLWL